MGKLTLTFPRTATYEDTIALLGMQEATWKQGRNWVGKPTLTTTVPAETSWEMVLKDVLHAYEEEFIDALDYTIEQGNTRIRVVPCNWLRRIL